MARKCRRKTRAGKPCKKIAGWGTDHVGAGACKLHGGKSTGPKDKVKAGASQQGNKNALKTGEYETIWHDTLTDDEKQSYTDVRTDVLGQLDEEIRLITIRERRMLQRIANLGQVDMTVVEESEVWEAKAAVEMNPDTEELESVDVIKTTKKAQGTLGQIQHIEEALTRVQAQKARLLDLKHRVEDPDDAGDGLKALAAAIRGKREAMGDEEDGDDV